MVDKDLEDYRKQALNLWFKDGTCTGESPTEKQDSKNEDDEFDRIEREQKIKPSSQDDKA